MRRTRRIVGVLLVVVGTGCVGYWEAWEAQRPYKTRGAWEAQRLCQRGYDDTRSLFVTTVDPVGDAVKWGGFAAVDLEKAVLKTWLLVRQADEVPIDRMVVKLGDQGTWGLTYRFRKLSPPLVACIKRSTGEEGERLGEINVRRLQAYLQGVLFACRDQRFRPRVVLIPKRDALWIYRRER